MKDNENQVNSVLLVLAGWTALNIFSHWFANVYISILVTVVTIKIFSALDDLANVETDPRIKNDLIRAVLLRIVFALSFFMIALFISPNGLPLGISWGLILIEYIIASAWFLWDILIQKMRKFIKEPPY